MKKIILWWLTAILSIISIASASMVEFTVDTPTQVSDFTYNFTDDWNFTTNNYPIAWLYTKWNNNNIGIISFAWDVVEDELWNGYWWLYFYWKYFSNNTVKQWYIEHWCIWNNCTYTTADLIELNPTITKVTFGSNNNGYVFNNNWFARYEAGICFEDTTQTKYCAYCWYGDNCTSGLTGTLNLNYNSIDDIWERTRTVSPMTETSPAQQNPETTYPCTTIDEYVQRTKTYNTGMCYTNTLQLSWNQIITVTPKTMTEVFPTYTDLRNSINLYYNYCTPPATQESCITAFTGKEHQIEIIRKLPNENEAYNVYDFCNLYLNYSGDTNICDLTPEQLWVSMTTAEWYAEYITDNGINITIPTSWSVFDGIRDNSSRDIVSAVPNVITKISWIFKNNTWVTGIIPNYITRIILLIVLYAVFKK